MYNSHLTHTGMLLVTPRFTNYMAQLLGLEILTHFIYLFQKVFSLLDNDELYTIAQCFFIIYSAYMGLHYGHLGKSA